MTASQNMLSRKGPTRAIKVQLLAQEFPHVPESIVQMLLELCQAWCCDHCSGQPVPVSDHPLDEEPFPDMQPKHPLMQFQAIPLGPVTKEKSSVPVPPQLLLIQLPLHHPHGPSLDTL